MSFDIPDNATIRSEYIGENGPYLYAYWKQNKKLKKKYIGKTWQDLAMRRSARRVGLTPSQSRKGMYVVDHKDSDDVCREYNEKCMKNTISIDWAYGKIKEHLDEHRIYCAIEIARRRGFDHQHDSKLLLQFMIDDMESKGFKEFGDDAIDSYLKTEFR